MDHLLLHCAKTSLLWELLFFTWAVLGMVIDTLLCWSSFFIQKEEVEGLASNPLVFCGQLGRLGRDHFSQAKIVDKKAISLWDCL